MPDNKKSQQRREGIEDEILERLERIERGLGRVESGVTRVEETTLETNERVLDVQESVGRNQRLMLNMKKGMQRLETAWSRSPYIVIVLFCAGAFFTFLLLKEFQ